jgi:FtsH-binding integral membrane protein
MKLAGTRTADLPRRTRIPRLIVAFEFLIANAGLLVLAFDKLLNDRWPIVALEVVALAAVVAVLKWGIALAWLVVGGVWVYASVIVAVRLTDTDERIGLALIFAALAFGALAAYLATEREML